MAGGVGVSCSLAPCLSFPLPAGKLPASWAGLWVGQRAAPQVYQAEPPQQGWCANLITEINCLFPRSVCAAGKQPQASRGGTEARVATCQPDKNQNPGPTVGRIKVPRTSCPVLLPCHRGWGLWAGAGTSWSRSRVSHRPAGLPREMSTDRPPCWGPRQRC